ncbi:hypothetical protein [Aureicoccus marinus]|nr:hypothetical protein [Aureicoccus marinus]
MKKIISGIFLILTLSLSAQKSAVFKNEMEPNRIYKTEMVTVNDMTMDMGPLGGKMNMNQELTIALTMTTEANQGDLGFPVTMVYDKMTVKMKMNGNEIPVPIDDALMKAKMVGMYRSGAFTLDKAASSNLTPELEESLGSAMKDLQDKVQFPKSALAVGDRFENSYPMDLPVPGGQPIKMFIKNNFKLLALEGGIGTFEVIQDLSFDGMSEGINMSATGRGEGVMKFDSKKNYVLSYDVVLPMTMNMTMEDGTIMKMSMTSNSSVKNIIE